MTGFLQHYQRLLLLGSAVALGIAGATLGVMGQGSPSKGEEVERLIAQLGSQEFGEREAAGKALLAIGEPALGPLRKAAENADAEVRRRAEGLVEVIIAQVSRDSQVRRYQGPRVAISSMAFSPDGQRVLSYSMEAAPGEKKEMVDRALRLWELKSEKELHRMTGHLGRVRDVSFSPDGRLALSTGVQGEPNKDTTVRLWDLEAGKELHCFDRHTLPVYSARFSPDGRSILTSSSDQTVRLWDAKTGQELRQFEPGTLPLALFSPDSRYILAWSNVQGRIRQSVRLWKTETGKEVRSFGDDWWFPHMAFSPDGRQLVIADAIRPKDKPDAPACGRIQLWDIEGKFLRSFEGHADRVALLAFSPDGRRLLSADIKSDVRLWDIATGQELRRFKSHTPIVLALAFTADGSQALTGHTDNSVTVWALPKDKPPKP